MQSIITAVCAAATLFLAGCATNDVTGESELRLMSPSQELALGEKNYGPMRQRSGGDYSADPELVAYVQAVGAQLAKHADRQLPYEFTIVNDSSLNAWALPGGKIAINRGLLLEMQDESELAAVLAHEIVHAAAGHSANQMSKVQLGGLGLEVFSALIDSQATRQIANQVGQVGLAAVQAKFGREDEFEADAFGMRYMAGAGYDLNGAVRLQQTFLNKAGKGTGAGLFASHPPSAERVARNLELARQYPQGGRVGREAYQAATKRLRITQGAYQKYDQAVRDIEAENYQSALMLVNDAIAIEGREGLFYRLKAEALRMLGRNAEALKAANNAADLAPGYVGIYLTRARIYNALGQTDKAADDYRTSRDLLPTSEAAEFLGARALDSDMAVAKTLLAEASVLGESPGLRAQQRLDQMRLEENPGALLELNIVRLDGSDVLSLTNHSTISVRHIRLAAGERQIDFRVRGEFGPGVHALTQLPSDVLSQYQGWRIVDAASI